MIEGEQQTGRGEGEQHLQVGERQPQGIPPLDEFLMAYIQREQQCLEPGEQLDPWVLNEAFAQYEDKISAKMAQVRGSNAIEAIKTTTPDEAAFWDSLRRVEYAFEIVAYPRYGNVRVQEIISDDVHVHHAKVWDSFTLTGREKATLQKITTAIGIPDNPQQTTYSFSSIPPAPKIIKGSIK